jgi:hypothetical protein
MPTGGVIDGSRAPSPSSTGPIPVIHRLARWINRATSFALSLIGVPHDRVRPKYQANRRNGSRRPRRVNGGPGSDEMRNLFTRKHEASFRNVIVVIGDVSPSS